MAKSAAIATYTAAFEQSLLGSASDFVRQRRSDAFEVFAREGFPGRKHEEYRYLDLTAIARGGFTASSRAPADPRLLTALRSSSSAFGAETVVVFVDGRYIASLSRVGAECRLHAWTPDNEDAAPRALHDEPVPADPMAAFAQAFTTDGVHIDVPSDRNAGVIHVLSIASGLGGESRIIAPRVDIRFGPFARATIVESFAGFEAAPSLTVATTRVNLGSSANVEHVRVHDLPDTANVFTFTNTAVAADATYRARTFSFGGRLVRDTFGVSIDGSGAHADLIALYHAKGTQVIDHHTSIDHRVPEATSHQLYRTLVDDEGHAVFNGKIFVRQPAQKTAAEQLNRNLLLSPDARVDTKPQLEIFADDVRCTHGATVGQLQRDELFYLQSRAISPARARNMLIRAFANEAFARVSDADIRAALQARLDARLPE